MIKKAYTFSIVLLVLALLGGCTALSPAIESGEPVFSDIAGETVTVVVTRDFGEELILEQETVIEPDTTALEALRAVGSVETKYGGGFVSSINGISSEYDGAGQKKDWFFYINGVSSKVGAGDYILRAGDIEHWDFRDWSYQQFIPAIIGDYPQPFQYGYEGKSTPTVVVYEEAFASEAETLVEKLRDDGVPHVSAIGYARLPEEVREQSNLIIVAGLDNGLIAELNNVHKKLGFYVYPKSGKIVVLDAVGNTSGEYGPGSGLLQATQNPWNIGGIGAGESVVWMMTGSDAAGVRSAASAMINDVEGWRHAFAAVVSEGKVVKIP